MTKLGARLILGVSAVLLFGGIWYYLKKGQLEVRVAEAQSRIRTVNRARSDAAPVPPVAERRTPSPAASQTGRRPSATGRQAQAEREAEQAMVDRRKDVVDLAKSGLLGTLRWAPPAKNDPSGAVGPIAQILALTPPETDALQRTMDQGKEAIYAAVLNAATVAPQPDGSYVISVRDSPDAQMAARQLQEAIRNQLGPERFEVYDALGAKAAVDGLFDSIGVKPLTLTVSYGLNPTNANAAVARGANPTPMYNIRRQTPSATGVSGMSGPNRDLIANNLGPLASLLPENF